MKQPDLGLKVSELRKEKGFTQEQLAEFCEITPRTIQRIESGEVEPRAF
ncbi:MAG: helix-turn-helix domain-containing protein, partial [Anaerolineales bacterium]